MKRKNYLLYGVLVVIGLIYPGSLFSQECGPSCPVCSGGSIGKEMDKGGFLLSGIFIPGGEEEKGVFKLRYGIFSWMDAGIGYTLEAEKIVWSLRVQAVCKLGAAINPFTCNWSNPGSLVKDLPCKYQEE